MCGYLGQVSWVGGLKLGALLARLWGLFLVARYLGVVLYKPGRAMHVRVMHGFYIVLGFENLTRPLRTADNGGVI